MWLVNGNWWIVNNFVPLRLRARNGPAMTGWFCTRVSGMSKMGEPAFAGVESEKRGQVESKKRKTVLFNGYPNHRSGCPKWKKRFLCALVPSCEKWSRNDGMVLHKGVQNVQKMGMDNWKWRTQNVTFNGSLKTRSDCPKCAGGCPKCVRMCWRRLSGFSCRDNFILTKTVARGIALFTNRPYIILC